MVKSASSLWGFQISFVFLFAVVVARPALATNFYQVNASASTTITEFSKCRTVTNGLSKALYVPTKTDKEWTAFINNMPAGVTAANCCPAGFVLIPANTSMATNEFCMMKWEARNVGGNATATSTGAPWNFVNKSVAVTKCAAMGTSYALPTNTQWTAMLRDAENVAANWSGGARKVGCMWLGNNGAATNCSYNGGGYVSGEGDTKGRYTLSNGQQIWHVNSNESEWVQGSIATADVARTSANPALGAKAGGGYVKLATADRPKWGPSNDDYAAGCGAGDDSPYGNCGMGYYMGTNGYTYVTRGGEAFDNRWDGFTLESYNVDQSSQYIGFRCAYSPW